MSLTYDEIGNLLSKTGITGGYQYQRNQSCSRPGAVTAGFNAVTLVNGISRCYDANGNEIASSDGREIDYNIDDKPTRIFRNGDTTTFRYGPSGQRYARSDTVNGTTTTTFYIGAVEITGTLTKRYVAGMVQHIQGSGTTASVTTYYQLTDHLGSVDVLLPESGATLQRMSFNAHGARRNEATWANLTPGAAQMFSSPITRFRLWLHRPRAD